MTPSPFSNIAVSLSGGGYRATTFHLGALAYLNYRKYQESTLLENVKIISTISGGTITGVMYALYLAEGRSFEDCYFKIVDLLTEDQLVDLALHKLNNPSKWKNSYKTRDLINAFSEVYNEHFYEQATFEKLYNSKESHLSDAIFGSSEFTFGIQFRLQEEHGKGKFGNLYLNLPTEASKQIRLADAVAASSCFPGGFEPIVMPKDFSNGPDSIVEKQWYSKKYKDENYPTTAIMDGGIVDNQGIEGVKLAEQRHVKDGKAFIGTYIVSDVSSDMMQAYKVPEFKYNRLKNWITLHSINILAFVIFVIATALLIFAKLPEWGIITLSVILPFTVVWFILFYNIRASVRKALDETFGSEQLPELIKDFRVILKTPLYILIYLIKFRATSVIKMVMDIFLRRIRRLQLNTLYEGRDWFYRFKSNYIYSLQDEEGLPIQMTRVVKAANNMPTTLWFSDKEKKDKVLDDLIACGQFTLCFNLIKYLNRIQKGETRKKVWDTLSQNERKALTALQKEMEKDWDKFKLNPYWLMEEMRKSRAVRA